MLLRQLRIAVRIQQTGFRGQQRAAAVDFDRPAFQDDPGREHRQLPQFCDVLGNRVVEVERRVTAAPGVVGPIRDGAFAHAAVVTREKNRAVIATPRFVSGEMMEVDAFEREFLFREQRPHPVFHVGVPDIDVHLFDLLQLLDELRVNGRHGEILVRKTDSVRARPGQPRARMRLPFRRHAKAQLSRSEGLSHRRGVRVTVAHARPP